MVERARPENEDGEAGRTAGEGATGVDRHAVGQGVSSTSAARTRTMSGETVRFDAVDYRAPDGVRTTTDARPRAVEPAAGADLGRASGVTSLRGSGASADARRPPVKEPLSRKTAAVIAGVLVVVAATVFVGGYFLARGVIGSVNESTSSASSAAFATDAYTLFAVTSEDGSLSAAYLGYVDSINERVELCRLEAGTRYSGGASPTALADVFASSGLAGLTSAVASLADAVPATAVALDAAQMDEVLGLASADGAAADPAALAGEVWDDSQMITSGALQGLLATMAEIAPENHVVLVAPAPDSEGGDGMLVLDQQGFFTMVRGMRDASGDVSLTS